MPAGAKDTVFEHPHTAQKFLAHVVGRQHPSLAGLDPSQKVTPESRKQLQPAIFWYDALAACAPAAYQMNAAQQGIRSEAALWLAEAVLDAWPGFHPTTQGELQEELERPTAALEEEICQLRALLAANCKRAIKDFWRCNTKDIVQRWKAVWGAINMEAPGVGPVECEGPEHPNALDGCPQRNGRGPRLLA